MKIIVPRKALNVFRKLCRVNYPNETMAVLRGVRTAEGVEITAIAPIPHKGTPDGVTWEDAQIPRSKIAALRAGAELIGTLHSHCFVASDPCCWHPSTADIKSALEIGEIVMGIVYVFDQGHKTEAHWYVPTALPEVYYKEE